LFPVEAGLFSISPPVL